ncbi:Lysine histidine transporter 1 [Micractinium conductrix]|uniref:Lysine histidine transporter 1 n=1 Tax=Micractinium conductrix TaxID=554055 RepID=A0A2P6VSH9_9CHLO|nr:Lysine histidine transporter 1 [Micractinium conductrix]|eukprot:PSC77053.1 Lysine histidine transporter 1 [Micractinium conductrix]
MLVCADGAPFLLGLPAAMARLGWGGGLVVLLAGFLCIMHAATRLVILHEHGGKRHNRYRELAQAVLGERLGTYATLPFQFTVDIGTCVVYQVVSGQALQSICLVARAGGAAAPAAGTAAATAAGCLRLSHWILIFSASQLLLCLLPDINSLGAVTALGAATTLGFSALATAGAAAHGRDPGVSYAVEGSPADVAFGAFTSLGAVFLLFGLTVLLEIQSTLAPVHGSAVPPMVKATVGGYSSLLAFFLAVAVSGYWAFGNAVQGIVLQSVGRPTWLVIAGYSCMVVNAIPGYLVFAHALFDWVDLKIMLSHWTGLEFHGGPRLLAKRFGFRWLFVGATAGLAVCLPFVTELMGLIGALGYVPLCFVLPCVLYLRARRGALAAREVAASWAVICVSAAVMCLAAIGSLRSLIVSSGPRTAATATNSRLENGVLSSADALADDVLDVPQGRSSSLRRSAAAAAAVASAAAENEALASLDAAQLDAAIAAALQRVAATMATAGNGPSTQGSNGATNGTAAAASAAAAAAAPGDEESWHRFIEDEVHHAFEIEIQELNKAVHDAVEAEMSTTQQSMRDAVDAALADRSRGITANVNTLMAVTGVIAYWRGVGGLLDILLEDSLEGYVFCAFFGFGVIGLIRTLKLPVVEGGSGIGF